MPRELIIDRNEWYRGNVWSSLYRTSDRKKCCLGFYSLACGLSVEAIRDVCGPEAEELPALLPEEMKWLLTDVDGVPDASADNTKLQMINDAMCDAVMVNNREQLITEIFAKHDVQVKFIN